MKLIPYKQFKDENNDIDTFSILLMFLNDARQSGGANFEEMGRRIDICKKIRALHPKEDSVSCAGLLVDEDEYRLLQGVEKYKFVWGANEHVYEIICDVRGAKAPEIPAVVKSA